ncbi:MAG: hypothetical protein IJS26_03735 [Alphaproteobacteria bacterium]|nr:hypothetical protein [Alphaproteobacteria bacterium]
MADTKRILHHIAELYAKPRANQEIDEAIFEMEEKLSARFAEYDKAFDGKITLDLIKAVDDYWRFKNDKTRPTLAQILALENSDVTKKEREFESDESQAGLKKRVINCMKNLYIDGGIEAAQAFHRALASKDGVPYPENIDVLKNL